ncbi:hypothetical protein N356_gp024 [Cellulophaga phage phi14:2]|uniref:hypothetical protein n=1 Tax=Cellulophaga phage phi14:2 TaxID=1327990 RepID=UPI00157D0326|nr:hypothetical protein N356_gp024 [Cellulophaga phage phi14:2]
MKISKEDNPVPSLEEKINKIIDDCIEAGGTAQDVKNSIPHLFFKENGVETDNEEPACALCLRKEHQIAMCMVCQD